MKPIWPASLMPFACLSFSYRYLVVALLLAVLSSCATSLQERTPVTAAVAATMHPALQQAQGSETTASKSGNLGETPPRQDHGNAPLAQATPPKSKHNIAHQLSPLAINSPKQTGTLRASELSEISGISASLRYPGLMYAVNDSGNSSSLYAIDETGKQLHQWRMNVRNRDWEDMTRMAINDEPYIVVGDTGDNLRVHKTSSLHFYKEPEYPATSDSMQPSFSVEFKYDDGPRNVEAFAAIGRSVYLLSKEPVSATGRTPNGIYQLRLPQSLYDLTDTTVLTAKRIGSMPLRAAGLEARLAAALVGVDLSHPTAMEFDASANAAYVLTYREVLRIDKTPGESWSDAFSRPGQRIHTHALRQAEALTTSPGRAVWFTSENIGAPIWAIPLKPQL